MESFAYIDAAGNVSENGILSPVPWWSYSKTVLAIAALRLCDRGLLALNESVNGQPFTLMHLLRHEAGLPDYGAIARYHEDVAAGKMPWPVERLLAAVDVNRLRFEPGKGWAYSNIGYLKVRELIEQASGITLAEALEQYVFTPAGVTTARLASVPADLSNVQMGEVRNYHPGWVYHGLVTGTAVDAARLLRALLSGSLLSSETFATMLEGHPLPEYRNAIDTKPAYGLGLMQSAESPLDHPLGHRGAGPGSTIAVYAKGLRTCAVWAAALPNPDIVIERAFKRLANNNLSASEQISSAKEV
jgi:CubicO group peptidase (beta-lactamase class C family)